MKNLFDTLSRFVSRGIGSIISLLFTAILAKKLNESDFGVYNLILVSTFYIGILVDWGMQIRGTRLISGTTSYIKRSVIFSDILSTKLTVSCLAIIIYIFYAYYRYYSSVYFYAFLLGVIIIILTVFLNEWFFQGLEKNNIISIRQILFSIFNILFYLAATILYGDFKLVHAILTYSLSLFASLCFMYFFFFKDSYFFRIRLDISKNIITLSNSNKIFLGTLILTTMYSSGIIFLGNYSASELGLYSTYYRLFSTLTSIGSIMFSVNLPRLSKSSVINDFDKFRNIIVSSAYIVFAIGYYLSNYIYSVFYPAYTYNSGIGLAFLLLLFLNTLNYYFVYLFLIKGEDDIFYKISLWGGLSNFLLLVLFFSLNLFNSYSVVLSLIISEVINLLVSFYYNGKTLYINNIKEIIPITFFVSLFFLLNFTLPNSVKYIMMPFLVVMLLITNRHLLRTQSV